MLFLSTKIYTSELILCFTFSSGVQDGTSFSWIFGSGLTETEKEGSHSLIFFVKNWNGNTIIFNILTGASIYVTT